MYDYKISLCSFKRRKKCLNYSLGHSYFSPSAVKVQKGFTVLSTSACLPSLLPFSPADPSGGILRSRGLHRAPRELDLYSTWRNIICSKTQYTVHTFLTKCMKMKEGKHSWQLPCAWAPALQEAPCGQAQLSISTALTLLCLHSGLDVMDFSPRYSGPRPSKD